MDKEAVVYIHNGILYVMCLVTQSCPTLCDPMDCSPPDTSVHGNSPRKNTGMDPGDLPNPGIEPRSPAVQADSLPAERPMEAPGCSVVYTYKDYCIKTHKKECMSPC